MKMLTIAKGVTSEYFHTQTDLIDFFHKLQTALKYETAVFQESVIAAKNDLLT